MEWQDILIDGYNRVPEYLERILDGLTKEDVQWQPGPDSNSIAWLSWHLTRQQDAQVAELGRKDQIWIIGGWASRFNRPEDPGDTGFGHTPEQVTAFEAPAHHVFIDYLKATTERTITYIRSLTASDLDRELGGPWSPPPTVGVRLVSILEDALIHAGQAAYIKGLRGGRGWQPY